MEYRTRVLLPGWTALRWLRINIAAIYVAAPLAIAMGLTSLITQSWVENPFVAVMNAATWLAVAAGLVSGILRIRCSGKEAAGGYTTVSGISKYDEVDGHTGLVVRASGEPAISDKERRARVAGYLTQRAAGRTTDGEA